MAIDFAKSDRSSIGVEWELQLIDCDDENLRQCGDWVIDQLHRAHPDTPLVHGEMLRNTVELVSRKQFSVSACAADLQEGIELLRPVLEPLRIDLASAGSHPFADPIFQRVSDSARYAELVNRTQF